MKALLTITCLITVAASFDARGPFFAGFSPSPFTRNIWRYNPAPWATAWTVGRPNFYYKQHNDNATPAGPYQPGLISLFCLADCRLAPVLSWNMFGDNPIPGRPFTFRTLPDWCSRNCPGSTWIPQPTAYLQQRASTGRRNAGQSEGCEDRSRTLTEKPTKDDDEDEAIGCEELAKVVTEFFRQLTRTMSHAGFQWLLEEGNLQGDEKTRAAAD